MPRGTESPHYRGKGYSRDLPTRYRDRLEDALEDPELTSLRQDIALLDARVGELLATLTEGGGAEAWDDVQASVRELRRLSDHPDERDREAKLEDLATRLEDDVEVVRAETKTWREVYQALDRRRRTAAVELKREEMLSGTLLATQAVHFMAALQLSVREEVQDPEVRARIARRLAILMNRPEPAEAEVIEVLPAAQAPGDQRP